MKKGVYRSADPAEFSRSTAARIIAGMSATQDFSRATAEKGSGIGKMEQIEHGAVGEKNLTFRIENQNEVGQNIQNGTAFEFFFEPLQFGLDCGGVFSCRGRKRGRSGRGKRTHVVFRHSIWDHL
ncbi:hypothetical protein SDC9_189967 [bioreactor metagenome]|uniref:Uncharacterized protein n=1 Tax=bioreactor metagenome TaxID=1076179 RepID=A0A645HU72_9ZZZZ